jgi:hypothetical protein
MIARVATFDSLPDDLDTAAVDRLREIVRTTPGYVAGFHLRSPEGGKAMSIVVLQSGEVALEVGRRLAARAGGERIGIDPDATEIFLAEPF